MYAPMPYCAIAEPTYIQKMKFKVTINKQIIIPFLNGMQKIVLA
jgi:hypothetical protein